jgi:hypothetical protein
MFHQRCEMSPHAEVFLLGLMVLGTLIATGCQPPPAPRGSAPAAAAPGAPPPPPGSPPPPPGTVSLAASGAPLEAAWEDLIDIQEAQFNKLAAIHNESQAEAAVVSAVEYHKRRHAALTKIASLGGAKPPAGVPAKYRAHYKAVEDKLLARDEVVSQMISPARRELVNRQLRQALQSDPELAKDPFALSVETRTAGSGSMATVTLVNNQSLQGPYHQLMIARLQQLAGASRAESLIENDGTYKIILSPVADFGSFIRSINFGDVSHRNDTAMTFTLTIDPQRYQGAGGVAAPFDPRIAGQPPGAGGSGAAAAGNPPQGAIGPGPNDAEGQKAAFFARHGGPEKCVTLVLSDAPRPGTPESQRIIAAAKQVSGARTAADLRLSGQRLILLAPVEDISGLATKINFGAVTGHDAGKREIYVKIGSSASNP